MTIPFSQTSRTITADRNLTDFDVRVFNAAASYRNSETGFAWPARTTLATIVGGHVGSVSRSMGRLADCGYITINPRPGQTNMIAIPSPYDINPTPSSPKPTPAPTPGPASPRAATVTLNPGITPTLNPRARQRNKSEKKNPTPPTPSPTASPKEEGDFRNPNPNPEPIAVTPIPINPEPIAISPEPLPVYQVEEEVIEYLTLDSLPAEIRALETPAQINPLVLLPILIALIGIAPDLAQALLDELAGRMSCQTLKAIDSPISYFRFLLREAKAGRFVPKYGADLVRARQAKLAHQARIDAPPPPPVVDAPTEPSKPSKYVPGSLRAILFGFPAPAADV